MIGFILGYSVDELPNSEKKSEDILELMDLNKDGRLSLEEFTEGIQSDKMMMLLLDLPKSELGFENPNSSVFDLRAQLKKNTDDKLVANETLRSELKEENDFLNSNNFAYI